MITEQYQQHWLRDLGLLTQPARETPEPERSKNGRTKTQRQAYCRLTREQMQKLIEYVTPDAQRYSQRQAYCRLTREQMQKLIEYVTPDAQRYLMHANQIYDATPPELLTDPSGNVMKWLTFRKLVEDIRKGRDKTAGHKKYAIIRMINSGQSIEQIIEKHPNISKKYVQEIVRELRKARK